MTDEMIDVVFCKKYQKELPAMKFPPLPGEAVKELMRTVSQKAFDDWKAFQVMLINENKIDLSVKENREWLIKQMHNFLDNKEIPKIEGFVEPVQETVQEYIPPSNHFENL
jgi:Fe-S cluster biosynthesis and repair protein YggX